MCRRCFCCNSSLNRHKRPPSISGIKVDTNIDLDQNSSANGGLGGSGGLAYNCANIRVNNIVVVLGNSTHMTQPVSFGINGDKLEITTDEEGNTFINGIKMEESALPDGTKVFLFKDKIVNTSTE